MITLENGSNSRQQNAQYALLEFPNSEEDRSKTSIYMRLLGLDPISLEILKHVGLEPGITTKELVKRVNLSRAPVLGRTKDMFEVRILSRSILAGTERHSKPTYTYSLPSDISHLAIECALKRLDVDKYLKLERPDDNPTPAISNRTYLATIEDMKRVLAAAVERISELENRLVRLETALSESDEFNADELLVILQSRTPLK